MLYRELFTGDNELFGKIFKERFPDEYTEIFADTKADAYALLNFGGRTVLESFTQENVKDFTGAVLDMCVPSFKARFDVFNKKYDFLKPVTGSTTTDKTVTVAETNTDGVTKSDKAFNDSDFHTDSQEDKLNDKNRTEKESSTVERTGFTGNVTQAMLDEYNARRMNLRDEIIRELISYLTSSIYN